MANDSSASESDQCSSGPDSDAEHDFSVPSEGSDIVLIVAGKKLHCHKGVLSKCSPVFAKMFTSDFKEKDMITIELPDKKYPEIRELVQFMCPPCTGKIRGENIHHVLHLSDEYRIDFLIAHCEEYLLGTCTPKTAMEYLHLGRLYQLDSVIKKAQSQARALELASIEKSPYAERVGSECIGKLIRYRLVYIEAIMRKKQHQFADVLVTNKDNKCEFEKGKMVDYCSPKATKELVFGVTKFAKG